MGPGQHRSLQWRPQQGHAVWARSRGSPGQHPDVLLTHRERYYITTVYCIIMMFFSTTMYCIFILHCITCTLLQCFASLQCFTLFV